MAGTTGKSRSTTGTMSSLRQVLLKVAQLAHGYAREVKNGPKSQRQCLKELLRLMDLILHAERGIENRQSIDLEIDQRGPLDEEARADCHETLSGLLLELQKWRLRCLSPLHEAEWREHYETLGKCRSLLERWLSSFSSTSRDFASCYNEDFKEQYREFLLTWLPRPSASAGRRPLPSPGTGKWFIQHDSVQRWIEGSSGLLWCYGEPGVGKTFLASAIVNRLLDSRDTGELQGPVLYFFCDFHMREENNTVHILQYLLRQVIQQGSGDVLAMLKESCDDPSNLQRAAEITQLISVAAAVQPIYLILDGVDQLNDSKGLFSYVKTLLASDVNVLVTSRDDGHIRQQTTLAASLEMKSHYEDLQLYVETRLQDIRLAIELDVEDMSVGAVISKSNNSFLLTRLILDNVLGFLTAGEMRQANSLSQPTLHCAFEALLQRINSQSEGRHCLARRLLAWVTYSKRRWSLQEIIAAFSIDTSEHLDPDTLIKSCYGLVTVDAIDGTIGLVHNSVYEFLTERISEQETNMDIASTCLKYLTTEQFSTSSASPGELVERLKSTPFTEYSARYWGHHISGPDQERQLEKLILNLLQDSKMRNTLFYALRHRIEFEDGSLEVLQSLPANYGALHITASWGLAHIAEQLLTGESVSSPDVYGMTPLHWACLNGHTAVTELLLQNGADVDARDIQGWTPLLGAGFKGHVQIVQLLLSAGANHQLRSSGWTALHWAIAGGHAGPVKCLLEHNFQGTESAPGFVSMSIPEVISYAESTLPIQLAAESGDTRIFELVLRHMSTPEDYIKVAQFNPMWAKGQLDKHVVNPWRMETKGERCNGRDWAFTQRSDEQRGYHPTWNTTLLVAAIRDSQLALLQPLIKAGADVNCRWGLEAAACRRDPRYARCLLENGADPNKPFSHRSPLHEAVLNGFLDTATALIDGGADVNQPIRQQRRDRGGAFLNRGIHAGTVGPTPLIHACGFIFQASDPELSFEMARRLVSSGADPSLPDKSGNTALHYAVMKPYLPLIKLLIEAGAQVDFSNNKGELPIHRLAGGVGEQYREPRGALPTNLSALPDMLRIMLDAWPDASTNMLETPVTRNNIITTEIPAAPGQGFVEEGSTPLGIALCAHRWEVARTFFNFGLTPPAYLDLRPILSAALKAFALDIVDLLLDCGGPVPSDAVHALLSSLLPESWKTNEHLQRDYNAFKRILTRLVAAGATLNSEILNGDTELTRAARLSGYPDLVPDLVKVGADVFASSGLVFDFIRTAAAYQDAETLGFLLDHAAAHAKEDHWSRYIQELKETSDPVMLFCLCLKKANCLDETNGHGITLLHLAADSGNVHLITSLLACGAKRDIATSENQLPIHYAGMKGHTAALRALLCSARGTREEPAEDMPADQDQEAEGFRIDASSRPLEGIWYYRLVSVFQSAFVQRNVAMVRFLLEYGMDPDTCVRKNWYQDMPMLYSAASRGHSEMVSLLLSHGADIEVTENSGWRPLHIACLNGYTEVAKTLIEAGGDIHARMDMWNSNDVKPSGLYSWDKYRCQPIHLATMGRDFELVKTLTEKGADIHAATEGASSEFVFGCRYATALHMALHDGIFYGQGQSGLCQKRLQIAQWCVERGAMVYGLVGRFTLEEVVRFRDFPGLWDALKFGDVKARRDAEAAIQADLFAIEGEIGISLEF